MITIMVVSQKNYINERIAASIVGGIEGAISVIVVTDTAEAESIIKSEKYEIDLFIFQIKSKPKSGTVLEGLVRNQRKYADKPVLFITDLSYNLVGFPKLAGYEAYKRKNYISMPIERLDVQAKLGLYLDEIIKKQQIEKQNAIYIEHSKGEAIIRLKDILYAEVQNKVLTLHCTSDKYEIKRMTLSNICDLVGQMCFVRCHKSFAVNVDAVSKIVRDGRRKWVAIFENSMCCPISQTYYIDVKDKYMQKLTK